VTPSPGRSAPLPARAALALLLLAALVWSLWAIPRGPGEFNYAGPWILDPWPWATMRGFTVEQALAHAAYLLLGLPSLVLLASAGLPARWPVLSASLQARLPALLAAGSALACAVVMRFVLVGPISDDEVTYRLQAELLVTGRLGLDLPELSLSAAAFCVRSLAGVTGKYLFGEPLVQAAGLLLGDPRILHVAGQAATVWLTHRAARRLLDDEQAALVAAFGMAVAPMGWVTAATGLSNSTALFATSLMVYGGSCCVAGGGEPVRPGRAAAMAALGCGIATVTRPQVGVPLGAIALGWVAWRLLRQGQGRAILAGSLVLVPFGLGIVAYDIALTGHALTLPWFLSEHAEHYGFFGGEGGFAYGPIELVQNTLTSLVRLNGWWLGWPCSWVVVGWWAKDRLPSKGIELPLALGLGSFAFQAGYYSPGISDTGDLYHHEWLIPGAFLLARTVAGRPERLRLAVLGTLVYAPIFCAYQVDRLHRLDAAITAPASDLEAQVPGPALVFTETRSCGLPSRGWLFSALPRLALDPSEPVVFVPRGSQSAVEAWRALLPGRPCYYAAWDTGAGRYQVQGCEAAQAYLDGVKEWPACQRRLPTARALGWVPPAEQLRR